ncbi:MAG: SPOR domain-containing protein [Abditibacteriales bacterium]|nr:SPOR domain-containing protein [Abditibacteriales bacterium]MDW8365136.1 SPOR domain-containing protein [Abditibacteriales bacterium]
MLGRILIALGLMLIFGAITVASYCVGKYFIGKKILRPPSETTARSDDTTPGADDSAPKVTTTSTLRPLRLTRTTESKRPDVTIEIKPKSQPSERVAEEPSDGISPPSEGNQPPSSASTVGTPNDTATPGNASSPASPQPKPPTAETEVRRDSSVVVVPARPPAPKTRQDKRLTTNMREQPTVRPTPPDSPVSSPQPERKLPPAPPPSKPTTPKPETPNPKPDYRVQVGAFDAEENARHLAAELQGKGYHAFMVTEEKEGKVWHKVFAGAFKDRGSAERLKGELEQQGYPVLVR